jgi:hypothetical protein
LVLGLASTAVSILLAPKAPALESPAKIKGKKLADQIGPSRFNQTTSFDNVSSLAEYGQPIPIPFGKRGTGSDGALTGGLILAPALVWSRLYSYGSYQAYEGIYVAGEYGVDAPELGGIRIGTTALNSLGNREFAVYWSSQLGENRPGYENQPSEDVGKIGQPGVGRAYSRRMGFIAHNGTEYENRTIVPVSVDDVLTFEINKRNWSDFQQEDFKGTEVNLKDLKNSADSWRAQASDLLTVGSKWIIGSSVWVVEDRNPDLWTKDTTQYIYFRCTAIFGVATVGIPGTRTVREPLGGYEGPWPGPGAPPFPLSSGGFNSNKHCGAAFFNICRLHMASIRPVRRDTEVVEIGIRSQVWNRANGLCNFNAIPSPGKDGKLHRMDKKNITLTTPRMDKYFERTSCFSLWVRPVQQYGQTQQPWTRIPEVICVTGNAPIVLYNYLRIRPRQAGYYEYRLVPRTGSDIAINSIDTNLALRLNSRTGNSQVADVSHYLELTKSNENGPEHEIVYVNECISNESLAEYYGISTLGLAIKSGGQLGGIGQLRAWVPTGISVYRLIEQDNKPSNLFADLVYYLLTSKSQGVGNVVPAELIDVESLTIAAQFQRANRIFFDGVVEDSDSLRSFLYDNAALQLCNFTIKNGRFGMMPALPYDSNYEISTSPIAVEQIFTAGNIIEDSLQVQYIDAAQRCQLPRTGQLARHHRKRSADAGISAGGLGGHPRRQPLHNAAGF